jgi:hypothetical protein
MRHSRQHVTQSTAQVFQLVDLSMGGRARDACLGPDLAWASAVVEPPAGVPSNHF